MRMNEKDLRDRAIIVNKSERYPDGFIRVTHCGDCRFIYNVRGTNIYECDIVLPEIDKDKRHEIHPDCPLPLVCQVREYNIGEPPDNERNVILKLRRTDDHISFNRMAFHWNEEWRFPSNDSEKLLLSESVDLGKLHPISWRELPGG